MTKQKLATAQCPSCGDDRAKIRNWLPEEGLEPRLREFKCFCGFVFYSRLPSTNKREQTAILGR